MYKLVKYNGNWADEMDVGGFRIMSDKDFKVWEKDWKKTFKEDGEFTFHVGTNEEIPYEDYESLMADFDIQNISKEEYDVISRLFTDADSYGYGFFPG